MSAIPARLAAALADRYRLERELGAGGMATVYLAQDLKHDRQVAIKVLRPELTAVIGAERFLSEIKTTANLQHPHILPLFDSGAADSFLFYVMPFIDGESLRDRLNREKQLPIADAVRIATEVAGALDYAHRRNVIHRDIKPENILLHDGRALVADFGIALAVSTAGATRMTETGMSLGTPAYMSPEQAMGQREITGRSDVYALGCVTYEMLAGEPPFTGPTAQAIIAKVMTEKAISPRRRRDKVPVAVDQAVLTALETLPADRFSTAAAFGAALTAEGVAPLPVPHSPARRGWIPMVGLLAAGLVIGVLLPSRRASVPTFGDASKVTYESTVEIHPALSPDGKFLAYVAVKGNATRVYVRQVNGGRPALLSSDSGMTEVSPSWSPDGNRIVYANQRGLFSVASTGGEMRQEASSSNPIEGVSWSPDGKTFAFVERDSIFLKPIGAASRFLASVEGVSDCRWSSDSQHLVCAAGNNLYTRVGELYGNIAPGWVEVVEVSGGATRRLTDSTFLNAAPLYAPDGRWIYFVSNRQGINDLYRIPATGDRSRIARLTVGLNPQSISLSADGHRLVFNTYQRTSNAWSVRIGKRPMLLANAVQLTRGVQNITNLDVSRDGRTLYYASNISGTSQIYLIPVDAGEPARLVTDQYDDFAPIPSPNGRELIFHSFRAGSRDIFLQPLDGGPLVQVTNTANQEMLPDWSPDGKMIAYSWANGRGGIGLIPREADGSFGRLRRLSEFGVSPSFSPDGRTLVFNSSVFEGRIYTVPVDSGPARLLIDTTLGAQPQPSFPKFTADGREIWFAGIDSAGRAGIWSVPFPAGGKAQPVLTVSDAERDRFGAFWGLGPDRIFVLLRESQSDIWVIETSGL